MSTHKHKIESSGTRTLATDTNRKLGEAHKKLVAVLERSKRVYGRVREKAVEGAKVTDEAIQEHPYHAAGVALAAGAVLGYLLARRSPRNGT